MKDSSGIATNAGEGQNETENHLRRGRLSPEQGIGRRPLAAAREDWTSACLSADSIRASRRARLRFRQDEEKYHPRPRTAAPHALARVGDDGETGA